MKNNSIKILILSSIFLFTCLSSEAFAETHKNSICEFNNYDGDTGRQKVIDLISSTFLEEAFQAKNSKFDKLDSIISNISNPDCKLQDGRPAINFVMFGFQDAFERINNWELVLQKIQALKNAKPNTAYPILVEAQYWVTYAWIARGGGFADSVTPEGWKLFRERLTKANAVLVNNKKIASTLPDWYGLMVAVNTGLNSSQEEQDKYFIEGFTRYKTYLPLYIAKRNSIEPKWGGSWQAVDNFINWAANNTKSTEGLSLYSRLYFGVFDNMLRDANFWEATLVSWPKFQQGFEDLIRLNPKSLFHLNVYASMACEAGDKKTYLKIRNKIRPPIEWSWNYNYSINDCDLKYGYKSTI